AAAHAVAERAYRRAVLRPLHATLELHRGLSVERASCRESQRQSQHLVRSARTCVRAVIETCGGGSFTLETDVSAMHRCLRAGANGEPTSRDPNEDLPHADNADGKRSHASSIRFARALVSVVWPTAYRSSPSPPKPSGILRRVSEIVQQPPRRP